MLARRSILSITPSQCHAVPKCSRSHALLCRDLAIMLDGDLVVRLESGDGVIGDLCTWVC